MGTINHDIIVIVCDSSEVSKLERVCDEYSVAYTTGPQMINGYVTITVVADGSKEWWPSSDDWDDKREMLLNALSEKDKFYCSWAHIKMGEIDSPPRVVDSSYA